jgi:hypothetical protein
MSAEGLFIWQGKSTLLWCPSQHRREGRGCPPDVLQARVVLLFALQTRHAVGQVCLVLLHAEHLVLEAPDVLARLESYALGIHARDLLIPWWKRSMKRHRPLSCELPSRGLQEIAAPRSQSTFYGVIISDW